MTASLRPETISFTGVSGNRLVADIYDRNLGNRRGIVLLLHGGGQTRHAWAGTAERLVERGFTAITLDQRGHGDSDWIDDGDYSTDAYAGDVAAVARDIRNWLGARPVAIGASLGGMSSMVAGGESREPLFSAVILVDITPKSKQSGIERVIGFMKAHAEEGFASIDEAADAVARYLPHRPRPRDLSGLRKNLRRHPDGQYRWHWDPRFLDGRIDAEAHGRDVEQRMSAVRHIREPILLVRGRESELVGDDEVSAFLKLVPHAEFVDVPGARHMVAGDRNDIFSEFVIEFLERLNAPSAAQLA